MDRRSRARQHDNYTGNMCGTDGWMQWLRPNKEPPQGGAVLWIGPFPLPHQKERDGDFLENLLQTVRGVTRIKMHHQFAFVTLEDASVVQEVQFLVGKRSVRGGPKLRAEHRVWKTSFRTVMKNPLEIHFSQPVVSRTFRNEKTLDETLKHIKIQSSGSRAEMKTPFRHIRIAKRNGQWVTMDNRRLCVLQAKAIECWPVMVQVEMYEFKNIPSEHLAKFDGHFSKHQNTDRMQVLIKETKPFANGTQQACEQGVLRLWSWEEYALRGMHGIINRHLHWITIICVLFAVYYRLFLWSSILVFSLSFELPEPRFLQRALVDHGVHGVVVCRYNAYCSLYAALLLLPIIYSRNLNPRLVLVACIIASVSMHIAWWCAQRRIPDISVLFEWTTNKGSHLRGADEFPRRVKVPELCDLPIVRDSIPSYDDSESSDSND
eukprot:GEMP01015939.1.p1 GENE.GEMP01015939.1~~GEMP01015939.1.p1  ORF type:complete len:434 (+),score=68.47 GEMP01015939.1:264-1565(+)